MKKLLLILLCVPLIGFGNSGEFDVSFDWIPFIIYSVILVFVPALILEEKIKVIIKKLDNQDNEIKDLISNLNEQHSKINNLNELSLLSEENKIRELKKEENRVEVLRLRKERMSQMLSKDYEFDILFDDAARVVVTMQTVSTSVIQRKMKIGYNRSIRIFEELEAIGVVVASEGSSPTQVLIKSESELDELLHSLKNKNE